MANEKKTATAPDAAAPAGEPMANEAAPAAPATAKAKKFVVAHGSIVLSGETRIATGEEVTLPAAELAKLLELGIVVEA